MADLWFTFWQLLDARPFAFALEWCPAHLDAAAIETGVITREAFHANNVADALADRAADAARLDPHVIAATQEADELVVAVQDRLVAVTLE
eukprot:1791648-Alexandrium_andersonii.AAC.1